MIREKGKLVKGKHNMGRGQVWYIVWSNSKSNTFYNADSHEGYRKAEMERLLGDRLYRWIEKPY